MKPVRHGHPRVLVGAVVASVPILVAVATVAFGWARVFAVLQLVMAILAFLLVLKAAIVFVSVGIRLIP